VLLSRKCLLVLTGVVILFSLAACSSGPAEGIDNLTIGSGYDAVKQAVIGQGNSFSPAQDVYIAFATYSSAAHGVAEVSLLRSGNLEDMSPPISVAKGSHVYDEQVKLGRTGMVTVQVSFNGSIQQTAQIEVG
jgi:hypothetical protein